MDWNKYQNINKLNTIENRLYNIYTRKIYDAFSSEVKIEIVEVNYNGVLAYLKKSEKDIFLFLTNFTNEILEINPICFEMTGLSGSFIDVIFDEKEYFLSKDIITLREYDFLWLKNK